VQSLGDLLFALDLNLPAARHPPVRRGQITDQQVVYRQRHRVPVRRVEQLAQMPPRGRPLIEEAEFALT